VKRWLKLFLIAGLSLVAAKAASAQGGFANGISWRYTPAGAFPAGGSVVTICTASATGTPCTPKISVFADSGLAFPVTNPLPQCTLSPQFGCIDNLGNFSFYAASGAYTYTITGAGLAPYGPIPINAINGVGGFSGAVNTNQVAFASALNTLAGSSNFTWNNSTATLNLLNTAGVNSFTIGNSVAATNIANQSSPTWCISGNFWTGAVSQADTYCLNDTVGAGNNPSTALNFVHGGSPFPSTYTFDGQVNTGTLVASGISVGSPGINLLNIGPLNFAGSSSGSAKIQAAPVQGTPNPLNLPTTTATLGQFLESNGANPQVTSWATTGVQCGTIAANAACGNTLTALEHCISGIATLGGGTSTITGISPAFTSAASWTIVANDKTTPADNVIGVPASGSTATFTGNGNDLINFIGCGG
jgi:hypothetical protein